jgi:hypothetical protein
MIDLHIHSRYSDGEYTPQELVQKAKKIGLSSLALTDHDTTAGVPEFLEACNRYHIRGIPGIELSVLDDEEKDRQLHILGYFIKFDHPLLKKHIKLMSKERKERALAIIEKLKHYGIPVPDQYVNKLKKEKNPGRVHIARILLELGYVKDLREAFHAFLTPGKPAFVPKPSFEPASIIRLIHETGGLAILAHPVYLKCETYKELYDWLEKLKTWGIDGVEVLYPETPKKLIHRVLDWVTEQDLLITGGSDFHGEKVRAGIHMGRGTGNMYIPDILLQKMEERLMKIQNLDEL